MIRISNITHRYGETVALNNINFEVGEGELFGLIGPDGGGKTTLFRLLTTLIIPSEGDAWVDGANIRTDIKEIRSSVGYMPGRFSLYQDLTVEENLTFFATVFNTTVEENYHLVKPIYEQLKPFKDRRAGKLSGGMKQKLALCCALIHQPRVLFLDEPTTGVDPVSRKEFWDMLAWLKAQGLAILVSTPYMDEANRCDRIALIREGNILQIDTPQAIIDTYPKPLHAVRSDNMFKLLNDLREFEGTYSCYSFGVFHHLTLHDEAHLTQLPDFLHKAGHRDVQIEDITPGIEDCFMMLS